MGVENPYQKALPLGRSKVSGSSLHPDLSASSKYHPNPNIEAIRGVFNVTDDGLIRVISPDGQRFRFSRSTLAERFNLDDVRERAITGTSVIFVVQWEDEARTQGLKVLYFGQAQPHFHSNTVH